jgi:hypothetical protein
MLAEAIGRPLRKVIASVHFFGGRLDDEPIHLWLSFEDLALFRLFGASDGWHLEVDRTLPEPTDMEESGEIVLVDVSNRTIFSQMIGRKLEGAWYVESPAGETIGIRFDFGLSLRPAVIIWGDELRIVDTYPPDAPREEIVETRIRPVALR